MHIRSIPEELGEMEFDLVPYTLKQGYNWMVKICVEEYEYDYDLCQLEMDISKDLEAVFDKWLEDNS